MAQRDGSVYLAVDLGASGGRVLAGRLTPSGIQLEEVHRFSNGAVTQGARQVWNLLGLWEGVLHGLSQAAIRFGNSVKSIGVDTWGVDYVLLDRNDDVAGPAFHYRDARTRNILDRAFERLSRQEIFAETGLQFLEFNTAYQLLSMRLQDSPLLDIAERFLMIPDYFHWQLSGEKCNEYTNASTTQLLNPDTCHWSKRVCDAFEIPLHIFTKPLQPGQALGNILPQVASRTGLGREVQVMLPATHDTGSAVLAVPANSFAPEKPDWCYISCGTWSLLGAELPRPLVNDMCQRFNFTNEGGVAGSVRLLKNIAGLWIVQQCRAQWQREGHQWSWDHLVQMAEQAPSMESIIDTDDPTLAAPDNMPEAIREFCQRTGQTIPRTEGEVVRCALESLALRYKYVFGLLEQLVGRELTTIHIVGGGVQNRTLCQMAADACQRRVVAGPIEATAMGNVLMQAIGLKELGSIAEARELVRGSSGVCEYLPRPGGRWDEGMERLKNIVSAK